MSCTSRENNAHYSSNNRFFAKVAFPFPGTHYMVSLSLDGHCLCIQIYAVWYTTRSFVVWYVAWVAFPPFWPFLALDELSSKCDGNFGSLSISSIRPPNMPSLLGL